MKQANLGHVSLPEVRLRPIASNPLALWRDQRYSAETAAEHRVAGLGHFGDSKQSRLDRDFTSVPTHSGSIAPLMIYRQALPKSGSRTAAPTGTITYDEGESFKRAKLSTETRVFARAYVTNSPTGQAIISWLQSHKVQVHVHFVAAPKDLPADNSEAAGYTDPVSSGVFEIYVVAGQTRWRMEDGELVGSLVDRDPDLVARTLLHEFLHAWFATRFTGRPYGRETGHTSTVAPEVMSEEVTTYDPESEYEPEFLEQLKKFDAELRDELRRERLGQTTEPVKPTTVPKTGPPR